MKKRILPILICALTLALMLVSCASLNSYKINLKLKFGKDYEVDTYSDKEIEKWSNRVVVNLNKYDISEVSEVIEKGKQDDGYYAFIIKCGSNSKAKQLAKELKDIAGLHGEYFSIASAVIANGKYVLYGSKDVINDALGK